MVSGSERQFFLQRAARISEGMDSPSNDRRRKIAEEGRVKEKAGTGRVDLALSGHTL